jgi:hypothetical protein
LMIIHVYYLLPLHSFVCDLHTLYVLPPLSLHMFLKAPAPQGKTKELFPIFVWITFVFQLSSFQYLAYFDSVYGLTTCLIDYLFATYSRFSSYYVFSFLF